MHQGQVDAKVINVNTTYEMNKDILSLKGIASSGGSVVVSAKDVDVLSLKGIASSGKDKGCVLIINDANVLDTLSCKNIASCNPGHVIFNFC